MSKPLILVVNDDGVTSAGILALVNVAKQLGDVVVVAPDSPQSGMGHAITIDQPLRINKVELFGNNIPAYQCSGTPADCVKIAVDKILHRKPDLCVSGINHGSNSSLNVIYSGTMSAATEAAVEDITAVGFSLLNYRMDADFSAASEFALTISQQLLEKSLPKGTLLNVNVPNLKREEIKGIKICRQAAAKWEEEYLERQDPFGRNYYWLTGKFLNHDAGTDTDEWALANGYVSIVPVQFDLTAYHGIEFLKKNWDL